MESHFNINIPDHGMATMTLSRVKKSKQWITILFGCNADGSEKLPLFFIGKAASHGVSKRSEKNLASTIETTKKHGWQQYCLKSKDILLASSFLVTYMLARWVCDFDKKMRQQKCSVYLLSGPLCLSWSDIHMGQVGHSTAACPRGTEIKGGMNQN